MRLWDIQAQRALTDTPTTHDSSVSNTQMRISQNEQYAETCCQNAGHR